MSGSTDKAAARLAWPEHVRFVWPWTALTFVVMLVTGSVILALHFGTSLNVEVLMVDPAAEVGLAPYVGIVSHIGVLLLWSATTVCVVGYIVVRREPKLLPLARCLGSLGVLAAWHALDDLFLVHEEIGLLLAEGLDRPEDRSLLETPVFLLYGVAWVVWLVRFQSVVLLTPFLLLGLSLLALGFSVAVDLGEYLVPGLPDATPWMATTLNMAEELAKLGGILFLLGYAMTTVLSQVTFAPAVRPAGAGLAGTPVHRVVLDNAEPRGIGGE